MYRRSARVRASDSKVAEMRAQIISQLRSKTAKTDQLRSIRLNYARR
jgi:hypothetical protein